MTFKRLIPKIVVSSSQNSKDVLYKSILTRAYHPFRVIGDPLQQQRIFQSHVVDEIVLINKISVRTSGRDYGFESFLSRFCESLITPLAVGGGINDFEQARVLFELGVDKIIVSQKSLSSAFVGKVIDSYGSQAVALSFDYHELEQTKFEQYKEDVLRILQMGFGEIFLNNVSRDGTSRGLDHQFLQQISSFVDVPVVVGCGAKGVLDIAEAFLFGASGVTTSTFLSKTDQSPKQIRAHLHTLGINIRVSK